MMIADLNILARDYWKTLTHPSPLTFRVIASHAHGRLILSMMVATLISEIDIITALWLSKNSWLGIILGVIESLLVFPLLGLLLAFFIYKICQNLFHRTKTSYEDIFYVLMVIMAVFLLISLISLLISLFSTTISNVVGWVSVIFVLILGVIAIDATARLSAWQSILIILMSAALTSVGGVVLFTFFGALSRAVPMVK